MSAQSAEVIRFPVGRTRAGVDGAHVSLGQPRGDVGLWLGEQEAIAVERQLEERLQLMARAGDVGAIASVVAAVTCARPQDCAEAARQISALLLTATPARS